MLTQQLYLSKVRSHKAIGVGLLLCTYLSIGTSLLMDYFILDATIITGIILSPLTLYIKKGECSLRYLLLAVSFLVLLFFIPINTVLFLTLVAAILFLVESNIGKINNAFFFLLILLSPLFNYFNNMISFPIRLWLSEIAGKIVSVLLKNVAVAGNIILVNGLEFSVDTACAGLKMLLTSFIIALVIIVYYQKKNKKNISVVVMSLLLLFTFVLNIVCNLFRIIMLVLFRILPDNPMHDAVGMMCLILYVILPMLLIFKYLIPKLRDQKPIGSDKMKTATFIINAILVLVICYAAGRVENEPARFMNKKKYVLQGYERTVLSTGVQKFENKTSLIYIKPLCFYSAEHNPMICWRGSGYEFKRINKEKINETEIYTGVLEKGKDKIYTAWWFDNGVCKTIEHKVWRWKAMKGEGEFVLININAANEKELKEKSKEFLMSSLKEE